MSPGRLVLKSLLFKISKSSLYKNYHFVCFQIHCFKNCLNFQLFSNSSFQKNYLNFQVLTFDILTEEDHSPRESFLTAVPLGVATEFTLSVSPLGHLAYGELEVGVGSVTVETVGAGGGGALIGGDGVVDRLLGLDGRLGVLLGRGRSRLVWWKKICHKIFVSWRSKHWSDRISASDSFGLIF